MAENVKKWLWPDEASQYLKDKGVRRAEKTLAKLRCIGGGPEFHKDGRYVTYTPEALDAYAMSVMSKPLTSTADYTASVSPPFGATVNAVPKMAGAAAPDRKSES